MSDHREYTYDVKLFATVRVRAKSKEAARKLIEDKIDGTDANFGAWDNGDPILATVSTDGEHDLIEIDGEAV